jgi:hypothetical protein
MIVAIGSSEQVVVMAEGKFNTTAGNVASALLVGAASVCIATLFYFLFEFGWTREREVVSWTEAIITCLVPALTAGVLLAALRLRPATRINIVLCVYSVAIACYVVEAVATVWFHLPSVVESEFRARLARAAAAAGRPFDTRSSADVVHDLRRQGIDAVPSIWARALLTREDGIMKSVVRLHGDHEVVPLAGISRKTTVLCNEEGEFLIYRADEHGFNNPAGTWKLAPLDIVAIGDSHVQGYCVPAQRHFVTQIRERYPATLNLGVQGNGPLVELATLKEYAAVLSPKRVLWFFCESNDVPVDLAIENKSPLLRRYLTKGFRQGIMDRQADIDPALSAFIEPRIQRTAVSRKLSEAFELARDFDPSSSTPFQFLTLSEVRGRLGLKQAESDISRTRSDRAPSEAQKSEWRTLTDLFRQILAEAQSSTAAWGGQLYFVYLPGRARYPPQRDLYPLRDDILRTAVELRIPVIDLEPVFGAYPDPQAFFPFRLADHYNEEGQRLVAQEVLRAISADDQR